MASRTGCDAMSRLSKPLNRMFATQGTTRNAKAKGKNTMEEPQGTGKTSDGMHYREIASKLREIARECRFPGARREVLDLASRLERRADDLDARTASDGSGKITE